MSRPGTPCPARETPPGLTSKKKQGWFGSFKTIVHQSALTAKAAVDTLRGVSDDASSSTKIQRTTVRGNDSPHPSADAHPDIEDSPKRSHGWHRTLSTRSAVSSLRSHLPLRSSLSKRGSLPSLFRVDSHSASLRGPEVFVNDSPPRSKLPSRLSEECKRAEGQMSPCKVPLPTSPISIPEPAPMLSLDLGPAALQLDFSDAVELDKEVKALQDPANFTVGLPISPVFPCQEEPQSIQELKQASSSPVGRIVEDQMVVNGTIHLQVTELDMVQLQDDLPTPCESVHLEFERNEVSPKPASRPASPLDPDDEDNIPYHGPPSPTRKVQLTLRPKHALFRSGSVQEKYFPHVTVGHATFVQAECNTSIDSDEAENSSPSRTPSMGDRLMFDMQRSERNARYNALYATSELQLADFDHAGPGSTPSSPEREESPTLQRMKKAADGSPGTSSVIRMVEDQILGWGM